MTQPDPKVILHLKLLEKRLEAIGADKELAELRQLRYRYLLITAPPLPSRPVIFFRMLGAAPLIGRLNFRIALWNQNQMNTLINDPLFRDDMMQLGRSLFRNWSDEVIDAWWRL